VGTNVQLDRNGMEILEPAECFRLVSSEPVGRIGMVADGGLLVLPVTHAVDGESVVFRTGPGAKLAAAANCDEVVFEVDRYDPRSHSGWSVVIRGTAQFVSDPQEAEQLYGLDLFPWVGQGGQAEWVRVVPREVSGRRVPT
jgi:uncharacterized protein